MIFTSSQPAGLFYNTESRDKYERDWHEQIFGPSLEEVRTKVS